MTRARAALLIASAILLCGPFMTSAMGSAADAQCLPDAAPDPCQCGPKFVPKKGCSGAPTKFMCPCSDNTNGFTTSGKCVNTFKCEAMSTSDGKMDQGMQQLMQMLGKLMEAMKGGGDKGGGGDQPQQPGQCTTLQPSTDKAVVDANPNCYYYQPIDPGSGTGSDPSGGLVATPTQGDAPLTVYFAYTNGSSGCKTPALTLDYDDGNADQAPTHSDTVCNSFSETTQHVYASGGTFQARLKNASTGDIKGGVNITVNGEATTTNTNTTDYGTGTTSTTGNSNTTGTSYSTGGSTSNISGATFTTPLNNLNNSGSVTGQSVSTGGSSVYVPATSASTGGSASAALNFNTPQSIVQSIIAKNLPPGAYGDVKILSNGSTIIAGVKDQNTVVAGFYGSNSTSGNSQGTIARMCQNRPWASNFLSYVIPPTFFDSLCTWRGYSVGAPAKTGDQGTTAPTITTTTRPSTTMTTTTVGGPSKGPKPATTTPANAPRVQIWASPETVPLGARTSIFWSTENVSECVETSPDGSFSHNSLKGGASTVPLASATTFTISCTASGGSHVTANVTVQIAL